MPGHRKRRQFKQTDAFTRGMVIGLKRAGWSIRQIAADTHLGASTVHRLWRRWLEQGNVAIYRNAGATRVTSARVDRRILRQAVAAPQATCTAILQHVQDTLDHSISTRTISRRLVANGLHSCRPLRRLPLTPPNRRQRLEWCRARSTWMTEWHRVVFSDESSFCLSSDSRRVRVWRRRGERSNPAAIVERPTVRQRGIMGVPNALYQQDNARPHTARISQQALQDVQMLPWPPYSPDLSPIEHVWDIIGRRLHALPQPRSEDELWQMVEREWRAIPQDTIRTLIDSLPRRVAACIAVRGQHTSCVHIPHLLIPHLANASSVRSGVILLIKGIGYPLKCPEYEVKVTWNHTTTTPASASMLGTADEASVLHDILVFTALMNRTKNSTHAGSSVARSNKGRLSCLGRGQDKEKKLQSPTQKDLKILQLNVEGFTRAKGEIIEKMMREHKADVIALQETHTPENSKSAIRIPGYVIICSKPHPKFGLAIYITYKLREETKVLPETSHSIGIQINDLSIYNVYKPPSQLWIPTSLPSPQHPAIVLGDFNSHHTLWGYSSTDNEGESLNDWMEINDMQLIFDAKKQGTFQSARWGKTYSPDLCFVTKDQCDNPIQIAHKILTKFPKSQHCPSIYEMGIQIPQIDSAPIPRWNLGKANWEAFTKYIEDNINLIPPTPKNYSRASNLIISCAKKFIPRGHRKIYIPCWSPESERLYQEYNLSGNTETAENLIRSLDDSRKHRWHTMLEQMDFSKSNHNEVEDAIKVTHNNRAPGPDGIMPEFMKHLGQKAIKWMAKLFTNILSTGSIPSVWKQAKVLAILKPGKTSDDPNNYRPISLLCIPYKILERIILNRISPIIEEHLPIEQAGFRPGRNCAEQTLALTTTIEDGFQKKLKTGAVFVDLTAAYDTVWREGLLYKLSKIINCKNIIKLINNFLTNRKITVHLNNKKSRPRTLNNGLPQGSVLAPLLFNVYTADIPATNSQKFLYADDIALLHQEQSFSTLEQILNEDLKKLENFFSKWHLIPTLPRQSHQYSI
ncbi:hypothetical protein LAZ67_4004434 [Cordylochernes scorpioides]|uniref:Reverse transcriptase domain-containing protein n=1 Tax=Cordylochernes scorpioides TaxID=51811 RepID=A0ABY6KEJ0_9ARAC|nr:hypothetical protein LAZ67_4004434 [Cordylochernes scorpioides]